MARRDEAEQRPAPSGRSTIQFPEEWGEPPQDPAELRSWILSNIRVGEDLRARGHVVPWLAERR